MKGVGVLAETEVNHPINFVFSDNDLSPESVFFDVESYRGKVIPLGQMREEVFTYFAEHLRRPTSRLAYWDGKDWKHPDGTNYREFFANGEYAAKTKAIAQRFHAEGTGWDNGGVLADQNLPFLIISLPGDIYRTRYGAKNMTYLVELVSGEGDRSVWRVLSVPSKEMDAIEHARAVAPVVGEVLDTDANFLVEHPLVATALLNSIDQLSQLDEMAVHLGYKSYDEILELAKQSLEAENDPMSGKRRELMVDYFAEAFVDAQSNVFYSEQKRSDIQVVLSEAMRYYFALEAGSGFIGKEFREIEPLIFGYVQDGVRKREIRGGGQKGKAISSGEMTELWEMWERENWRRRVIESNEIALESYQSTGCVINLRMSNGQGWNELVLDSNSQVQLNNLFGADVRVGYATGEETKELGDGETACYRCPVCEAEGHNPGGVVKRQGSQLVCQDNPEKHRIKYESKAG